LEKAIPNCFPFIGRLFSAGYTYKNNRYEIPIHGFATTQEFSVEQSTAQSAVFSISQTDETLKIYPFIFDFSIEYRLVGSALTVEYIVHNPGGDTLYYAVGAHPGFNVPLEGGFEDWQLDFEQDCQPVMVQMSDDCLITSGDKPYEKILSGVIDLKHELFDDDAFILRGMPKKVVLKSKKSGRSISVSYPEMDYCAFWHKPKSEAPYVCIEPWSSLPGRSGVVEDIETMPTLLHLDAGQTKKNALEYRFS
jgi:galactose mutarotase-like enzyme